MSFTRLHDDACAIRQRYKQSTSQLDFIMYKGKHEHCVDCKVGDYKSDLSPLERTIVENELYNLSRTSSTCPGRKFQKGDGDKYENPKYSTPRLCEGIYYMTPTNLYRPKGNMLREPSGDFCN